MSDMRVFILIAVMALVTIAIRFLPFVLFNGRKTPEFINYLSKYLSYSVMGMLVVYCLKDVSITTRPYGIAEFIGVLVVASLHIWKRNTLLSIVLGTIAYMVLKQLFFI